jgi:hypothetical protein
MNWVSYILAALVAALSLIQIRWDYLLKYFFKDGRTNEHKNLRIRLLILTLFVFMLNQFVSITKDYKKEQQSKKDKQELRTQVSELTNQLTVLTDENLKLREEVSKGFQNISREFSTNNAIAPDIRVAVLNDALRNNSEERVELQQSHQLFNVTALDMKTLRAEFENELALEENKKKQMILQQEIDEIQKRKDAGEAAKKDEQAAKNQKWANEELARRERSFANQILPVFDYAIRELDKMLAEISDETGQNRHSDFLGETPTVYASALVKAGMIIDGTNTIGIGTNSAWNFKILTSVSPLHAYPSFSRPPDSTFAANAIRIQFSQHYSVLKITSGASNNESTLIIEPFIPWNSDIGYEFTPSGDAKFYSQISIKLNVPNGLNIDEVQPSENFKIIIDKALHRLIASQDQQFPVILKVK